MENENFENRLTGEKKMVRKFKIHGAQKKVILSHLLNANIRELPSKVGELDNMLDIYSEKYPDQYERIKNIVLYMDLPDAATPEEKDLLEVGKLIRDELIPEKENLKREMNLIRDHYEDEIALESEKIIRQTGEQAAKAIQEAANKFQRLEIKVGNKKLVKMDGVLPAEFEKIVQLTSQRVNTMLVGPSGCGKTYVAGQVAKALGLDFAAQSCSAGMSESLLTGWLIPTGDNGKFEYVQSEFVRLYENGGVFLFDEIDAADPNVLIFINAALANGELFLPQRYNKPKVKRHKDFVAIAAANTFGGGADAIYNARNQLDGATLDRFRVGMVAMDYDERVERKVADAEVYDWGIKIRNAIKASGLKKILSTRVMIDATTMKENCGWTIADINESYLADWSREEKAAARLGV